jgi:hypothetical protein
MLHPLLLALGIMEMMHRSSLTPVLLPLTVVPAFAPLIYLTYAQYRARGGWLHRTPQILGATVLGAAVMTTTTMAMLKVLSSKHLVFERTPKYGIAGATEGWDGKRYGPGVDPLLGLEILVACYGCAGLFYAVAARNWASLFFSFYMLAGILLFIVLSFAHINASLLPRAFASSTSGPRE